MKKRLTVLFICASFTSLFAQQIGMYSHYFYQPMIYNPAYSGAGDATNAMLISRAQWSDFKGAPQLNMVTLDGSLLSQKVGLGMTLLSDRKGITNRMGGNVSYSYRLKINDDMGIRLGASVGVIDQRIDFSKALLENASDPTLFTTDEHKTLMDANAGLVFYWKGLDFSAAAPQLLASKVKYVDNQDVRAYYAQARHYMGALKYKFFINKEKGISITPLALVRFVPNTPFQYDGNLNFEWQDKFWIGATYKSDYAVSANAGFVVHKQLSVGYSYDFIIGNIGKYSGMAHELMVNVKFGKKKEEAVEKPKDENKILENTAYVKRMDSLQNALEQSNQQLKALSDKLDQQAKNMAQQQQVVQNQVVQNPGNPDNSNQNNAAVAASSNKVQENGVWVVTNKTIEFKDENNHEPQQGYYVVVGTFVYKDFAIAEVQRFRSKGYGSANYVYYDQKQYNYVFIARNLSKDEAMQKVKDARAAGINDAWIQVLEK